LSAGADVDKKDKDHKRAATLARMRKNYTLVSILESWSEVGAFSFEE